MKMYQTELFLVV